MEFLETAVPGHTIGLRQERATTAGEVVRRLVVAGRFIQGR